jgi:hypothetical protein
MLGVHVRDSARVNAQRLAFDELTIYRTQAYHKMKIPLVRSRSRFEVDRLDYRRHIFRSTLQNRSSD